MDAFANVNPCYDNGTDAWQQWNVMTDVDDTVVYFQNAHTGQCLDDDGQLSVNSCNGGGYQTWRWDGSL